MGRESKKLDFISADEWLPFFLERMKQGQKLRLSPFGVSMYPFLVSGRDDVILELPKESPRKGDICLYRRKNGIYVLHRVHHIKRNGYYMLGDSQTWIEGPIEESQIVAIATTIIRKGRNISTKDKIYTNLYELWSNIRPLRPLIIRLWLNFKILKSKLIEKSLFTNYKMYSTMWKS